MRAWDEGVYLRTTTGRELADLRDTVVSDRVQFAALLLSRGNRLVASTPPHYRDAISRFYYSMYHAMRAAVYYDYGGDDHQAHSALPRSTPASFPDRELWSNRLKSARERRNGADYDPYPKAESAWRDSAVELQTQAEQLLRVTRRFLRDLGCDLR